MPIILMSALCGRRPHAGMRTLTHKLISIPISRSNWGSIGRPRNKTASVLGSISRPLETHIRASTCVVHMGIVLEW